MRIISGDFKGKKILKLAPDYEFISESIDVDFIPPKNCIFKLIVNFKRFLDSDI